MPRLDSEQSHALGDFVKRSRMLAEALNGDILFVLTPPTAVRLPTAAAFTRDIVVEAQNAAGEVHEWLNVAIATGVSVGDTSTAGTASIPSTTLTLVKGRAVVTLSGDAAAWLDTETNTLTVAEYTGFAGQTLAAKTSVETITA